MGLRVSRIVAVTAALGAASASASPEVGVIVGARLFNDNNELGVVDSPTAAQPRSSVLFGLRGSYTFSAVLGVEGEVGVIPTEASTGTVDLTLLTYRVHLLGQFGAANPDHKVIPFAVLGAGAMTVVDTGDESVIGKDTDEQLYVGAGVKLRLKGSWGLRADARLVFPPSTATTFATVDGEVLLSVYRELGGKLITIEEEPPPPPPPPPPADSDGDGLNDDVDKCPNEAEDKDNFQDEDGCPDPDNDQDGVADAADNCKTEPEDKDGFADEDGCPEPDNDADGIDDKTDKCPLEPEDKDGFQDDDGCPDPDNDGDGVLDANDQCPDKQETPNGFQDSDGCPDDVPKAVQKFTGVIKGITFKTNSDVILKSSNKTLNAAVKILNQYPDLKLEIQGHTDDVAEDNYNLELSQRRADAVKAYFVGKGIGEDRLVAKGYGETAPLIPKKTKAARAKNRRVEFKLITELAPTPPATQPTPPTETQPTPPPTPETQPTTQPTKP